MKPEQETDDDEEGYVTDEDEAADISPEAAATLEKAGESAEGSATSGATASASPPVKRKEKKPKKVRASVEETLINVDHKLAPLVTGLISFFTINFSHLHYNIIQHFCGIV